MHSRLVEGCSTTKLCHAYHDVKLLILAQYQQFAIWTSNHLLQAVALVARGFPHPHPGLHHRTEGVHLVVRVSRLIKCDDILSRNEARATSE